MSRDSQADSGRQGSGPPSREAMSREVPPAIETLAELANANPDMMGTTASDYAGSTTEAHRRKRRS